MAVLRVGRPTRIWAALAVLGLALLLSVQTFCFTAWLRFGIWVAQCPDGRVRQRIRVEARDLRRGTPGFVRIASTAYYTTGPVGESLETPLRRFTPRLSLVDHNGLETALEPLTGWKEDGQYGRGANITLPADLPDGEYALRARTRTPLGEQRQDVELPLYAPARVHVLSDRPLYEAGNTVEFRALVVRARDLAPIEARPGRWMVEDPDGNVILEERATTGEWGLTASRLPLDRSAPHGRWTLRFISGQAQDEISFEVRPFSLARFRVEATPTKSYYRPGDRPRLEGAVTYSSGAPVVGARVTLEWTSHGQWPPPSEWLSELLPRNTKCDGAGRFAVDLPEVPADLRGQASLQARLTAYDPTGDRVEGQTNVLLSEDGIEIRAVTELEDGVVEGYSNRVYLRVSLPSGQVLAGAVLSIKRAWDPRDQGLDATADQDGVAALQLDPGPPVNVVLPAQPVRVAPAQIPVVRQGSQDLVDGRGLPLGDERALDDALDLLAPCARFVDQRSSVQIALAIDKSGAVVATSAPPHDFAAACLTAQLKPRRFPTGPQRLYALQYILQGTDLPRLRAELTGVPNVTAGVGELIDRTAHDARACLPPEVAETFLPRVLIWNTRAGQRALSVRFVDDPRADSIESVATSVATCIEAHFTGLLLPEATGTDGLGTARFSVAPANRHTSPHGEPITTLGYELAISARRQDEVLGSTRIILAPGTIPALRLRATPVLAEPGAVVEVAILRGPGWRGELPDKIFLTHEQSAPIEAAVDVKTKTAHFVLPRDRHGWFEAAWGGACARIYVPPADTLALDLKPARHRYAPGEEGRLYLHTHAHGQPVSAAVTLVGVDDGLADLVTLPGPTELARLRPQVEMSSLAFGVLDAQALVMGRMRGANAIQATVLRVSRVPSASDLDEPNTTQGAGQFDPLLNLTDHFYGILTELHLAVRNWEETAPSDEQIRPETMARLWRQALEALERRGEAVDDAYGRKLRLSRLPPDLLALTDPRSVVTNARRLSEDVENWAEWVARERP